MTVPVHGLPPLLQSGMTIALVPPPLKESRWHEVEFASDGGSGQLVSFGGITDIASAEAVVGCMVLADIAELPDDYAVHDIDALLGREVVDDAYGPLGTIEEVLVGAAHDVWVVQGSYGEVLIPVVDEFVSEVETRGPIRVRVPEGTISSEGRS